LIYIDYQIYGEEQVGEDEVI